MVPHRGLRAVHPHPRPGLPIGLPERTAGKRAHPRDLRGLRRQRFRWTYGPVQELRRHLRLFLPRPFARDSRLDWRQRVHHANHGLDVALVGVRTLAVPIGALAGASMLVQHERVGMPFALWLAATAMLVGTLSQSKASPICRHPWWSLSPSPTCSVTLAGWPSPPWTLIRWGPASPTAEGEPLDSGRHSRRIHLGGPQRNTLGVGAPGGEPRGVRPFG